MNFRLPVPLSGTRGDEEEFCLCSVAMDTQAQGIVDTQAGKARGLVARGSSSAWCPQDWTLPDTLSRSGH